MILYEYALYILINLIGGTAIWVDKASLMRGSVLINFRIIVQAEPELLMELHRWHAHDQVCSPTETSPPPSSSLYLIVTNIHCFDM